MQTTKDSRRPVALADTSGRRWLTDLPPLDSAHSTSRGQRTAPFQHAFASHPLLQIPALIELSRSLPPDQIRFHAAAMKEDTNFGDVSSIPKAGATLEDALARIEESGSWVQLNHIETVPAYRELIEAFLHEARPFIRVDRASMHRREGYIFVASPGSLTPFHCDHEPNFICQVRGRKDLYVWDPDDRVVLSQAQLESFHGLYSLATIQYRPALMGRARLFPLEPGNGAFVPQDAPHMVKTGDRAAVTLSISYFRGRCEAQARRLRDELPDPEAGVVGGRDAARLRTSAPGRFAQAAPFHGLRGDAPPGAPAWRDERGRSVTAAAGTYATIRWLERSLKALPPVRAWQERAYERMFASDALYGSFRGVFRTFDEARASAPKSRGVGFDHPAFGNEFRERLSRVYPYDYPVLFWLRSLLEPGVRVFDYGGHIGVHFYAYRGYLDYPAGLRWCLCDVPAVVEAARSLAHERGEGDQLTFTTDVRDAEGFHVLIAAGSLQYVEKPSLAVALTSLARPPQHLILNKLPLYDGDAFVTLQNAGPSFVPQHVFNREAFVEGLRSAGYEVVDAWEDRVHSCRIPFDARREVPQYSGLYLRRGQER